jgi:hypothetical protein
MDIRPIVEYFRGEGKEVAKAPGIFMIALALLGGLIYWMLSTHYSQLLTLKEEQLKSKEEQLKGKENQFTEYQHIVESQLKSKDDQLKGKDDQLKGKDDVITEYRERLHYLPPAPSPYLRMTNAELQQKALTVVQQLRQFTEKTEKKSNQIIFTPHTFPPDASEEEKARLREQHNSGNDRGYPPS